MKVQGKEVSTKEYADNKVAKTGDTMSGDLNFSGNKVKFSNNGGIEFKENGYGDKFRIIPDFNGARSSNRLLVQSTVGDAGTDPTNWKTLVSIHAETGEVDFNANDTGWVDMSISGSAVTARDQGRYKPQVRKIGNLVQIKGQIMASSNLNDNTSLSMPTEFIPNDMELSYVTNNASIWVALTGELHITSTSSSYININTCYMLS